MQSKYEFYEVVKIQSDRNTLEEVVNSLGAVLGKAQNDEGDWVYSVHVFRTEECWEVAENELRSTGKVMTRDEFYDGESIKVFVDPVSGEGSLKKK